MSITAAMIKELRERTGAGMMDCKKILTETNGDMDLAIEDNLVWSMAVDQGPQTRAHCGW